MKRAILALFVFLLAVVCHAQAQNAPLLLQEPTLSRT